MLGNFSGKLCHVPDKNDNPSPMTESVSAHRYRALLESGRWFREIPAALQARLIDTATVERRAPGERLFVRDDPASGLYGVVEGAVRITAVDSGGKEALLTLIDPPNWFGEIALFDGLARTHDAVAEGRSTVLHVPRQLLDAILDEEPRYWRAFGLLMAHKLRLAFVAMEDMALLPAPARLAHRLLLMIDGYGEGQGNRRVIHVRQEQLALMLSISRQTTNRILKDLQARSAIQLRYGEIEIIDLAALRTAARIEG